MILPESIIAEIIADGYCTDVIKQFNDYCRIAQDTFANYCEEDTPWHLWEAYEACVYPYSVICKPGPTEIYMSAILRFASHDRDLERDVLPTMDGWHSYDEWPIFEHPSFGGKQ